jgi:hypothetical protein
LYQRRGPGETAAVKSAARPGNPAIFSMLPLLHPSSCREYSLSSASADAEQLRGIAMKYLALILVCCTAAAVIAPKPARAFDIQGQNAAVPDAVEPFSALFPEAIDSNDARGSSLALPYIGKSDSSVFISDYGNGIAIPAPGVDRPTPAWAYR